MRAPIAIIALGNTMRHDDGVGAAAAKLIGEAPPPATDVVVLDGEATRLIDAWRDRRRVIVIDAVVAGATPGTIHEVELSGRPWPTSEKGASTHNGGVVEAIALGRVLGQLPGELLVVGVEPGDLSHGPGLSAAVEAALAELVVRVRERVAR